ncbi:MAG: hypothetical protein ABSC29_03045 [Minisyncoccia bacterium]|jgi:hypothetical protein
MYIWLTAKGEETLRQLKTEGRIGELKIETHRNSGLRYVPVSDEITDPTATLIPQSVIDHVTLDGRIQEDLRPQGIYVRGGATAQVETVRNVVGGYGNNSPMVDRYQMVRVVAKTVRAARAIYSKVRSGELKPKHNWTAGADRSGVTDAAGAEIGDQ